MTVKALVVEPLFALAQLVFHQLHVYIIIMWTTLTSFNLWPSTRPVYTCMISYTWLAQVHPNYLWLHYCLFIIPQFTPTELCQASMPSWNSVGYYCARHTAGLVQTLCLLFWNCCSNCHCMIKPFTVTTSHQLDILTCTSWTKIVQNFIATFWWCCNHLHQPRKVKQLSSWWNYKQLLPWPSSHSSHVCKPMTDIIMEGFKVHIQANVEKGKYKVKPSEVVWRYTEFFGWQEWQEITTHNSEAFPTSFLSTHWKNCEANVVTPETPQINYWCHCGDTMQLTKFPFCQWLHEFSSYIIFINHSQRL